MSDFSRAVQARYTASAGDAAPTWAAAATANPVIASLLTHRSVRAYLPDPVSESDLAAMMVAAQSAATSSNLHAWSVVAVTDPERKARLAGFAGNQAHIRECPLLLVWLADLSRLDRIGESAAMAAQANHYLEMFLVAVVDAALAAQNATAAAEALGLGTVYIGAMRNRPEDVARELALPAHTFAVFGLCVGRPDPARPSAVKPRLEPSVMLHRERYGMQAGVGAAAGAAGTGASPAAAELEAAAFSLYNQRMRAFQASQGMPAADWTQQSATRVRGPESLSGRDRLRAALASLGFRLD